MALGVLGVAYVVLCPHQYHRMYSDFIAGFLVGIGLVAFFVKVVKT